MTAILIVAPGCRRAAPNAAGGPARPNVLLVTIDTWRADRLGVGISPVLDALARSNIRFTAARAAAPLTLPSHTTMLTGLLPPVHGVHVNGDTLSAAHPTIARLLKDAGYRTAAFVGAFVLDRRFGLANGFDTYDDRVPRDPDRSERLEAERPASAVIDAALEWLNANGGPFFVWIHLYDPHAPYSPPAEFINRVDARAAVRPNSIEAAYDGEIAYVDVQLARIFSLLQRSGVANRTLLIVVGDHGEGLEEHGERTHGMLLYDSTLRVPLVIAAPWRKPAVKDEAVSLADVAPTILAAAGLPRPAALKGRDLLDEDSSRKAAAEDLYSETEYPRAAGWSPLRALTDGRWTIVRGASSVEVYDIVSDPKQQHDVAATEASLANAMTTRIEAIRAAGATGGEGAKAAVGKDVEERLRALGYVTSSANAAASSTANNPATVIQVWNRFEEALGALEAHRPDAPGLLEQLADEHPESPVFQATAARVMKQSGHLDRALAAYRNVVRRWPTDSNLLHDLAATIRDASLMKAGPSGREWRNEAEKAERAALALSPDSAIAHNGLGLLLADDGRTREAEAEFAGATKLDPNNASYLTNLGNARRSVGDRVGAESAYRDALQIWPQTVDAANGLGVLLVEAKRPAEAVAWFERALSNAPGFIAARLNLGIALQESGQRDRAAAEYRRVLASPDAPREKTAAAKLLAALRSGQ